MANDSKTESFAIRVFCKMSVRRTRDSYGTERGEDTVAALFPRKGLRPFPWKARDSPVADLVLYSCFAIHINVMSLFTVLTDNGKTPCREQTHAFHTIVERHGYQ
jgi:hypothetical protein